MAHRLIDKPVWTHADYRVLSRDFNRHKIMEGDHVVTPPPSTRHQRVPANLTSLLDADVRAHNLGRIPGARGLTLETNEIREGE